MLISHEVPISMLESSKAFNDYDYCLLHLTYERSEYKQYYINSIKNGRKVLLDNSLFELGDALTNEQLAKGVIDINPTWYVIPDCLNNKDITIERFSNFVKDYSNLPGLKIGVAQGSSIKDLTECYKYMSEYADKIAIPFDSEAFEEYNIEGNQLERWCQGRQRFIGELVENKIWSNKPHHLLGCSFAKEFSNPLYRRISIESIDTSNPIVVAISGLRYNKDGLAVKPSIKLCELIDHRVTDAELELITYNTTSFRNLCQM